MKNYSITIYLTKIINNKFDINSDSYFRSLFVVPDENICVPCISSIYNISNYVEKMKSDPLQSCRFQSGTIISTSELVNINELENFFQKFLVQIKGQFSWHIAISISKLMRDLDGGAWGYGLEDLTRSTSFINSYHLEMSMLNHNIALESDVYWENINTNFYPFDSYHVKDNYFKAVVRITITLNDNSYYFFYLIVSTVDALKDLFYVDKSISQRLFIAPSHIVMKNNDFNEVKEIIESTLDFHAFDKSNLLMNLRTKFDYDKRELNLNNKCVNEEDLITFDGNVKIKLSNSNE
ncbi:hypothetical protein [Flammeovirga sp. EKP202]|uniref:hypothetical protein n=1 Tax=Flammeovirga sp. EKP202 TaxID=2770592 RepID=UPI00165F0E03|nr:hypothetical protein [Flammeovirga sp. EKP202]MBD0401482.1 hypothetical protein [Flammeovirga sp. EKP202]